MVKRSIKSLPLHPLVHDRYSKKSKVIANQKEGNLKKKIPEDLFNGNQRNGFSVETNGQEIIKLIGYVNNVILPRLKYLEEKTEYLEQKSQFPVNTLPKFDPYGFDFEDSGKEDLEEKVN